MIFTIPFFGKLSDRVGRRKVYAVGSLVTALSSFAAFYFMTPGADKATLWLAIIIPFGILYASVYGPEAALFCELFDARVRYTGISFVYQFSGIFASGITPIIATALIAQGRRQAVAALRLRAVRRHREHDLRAADATRSRRSS